MYFGCNTSSTRLNKVAAFWSTFNKLESQFYGRLCSSASVIVLFLLPRYLFSLVRATFGPNILGLFQRTRPPLATAISRFKGAVLEAPRTTRLFIILTNDTPVTNKFFAQRVLIVLPVETHKHSGIVFVSSCCQNCAIVCARAFRLGVPESVAMWTYEPFCTK